MRKSLLALGSHGKINRRQFFHTCASAALVAGMAGVSPETFAKSLHLDPPMKGERELAFYHTHTGESLKLVYWENGDYLAESLSELNFLLRDFRTDDISPIHPALFDLLHRIQTGLHTSEPFHIISAYRSPATNQMLQESSDGVAKHSLHMEGMAMDVRVPGRSLRMLRHVAMAQKAGGVGYYPASQFVHVDVGRVRHW